MFKNNRLRKNNGFLLISTYFFIILLVVFAATFFSQAVHEHKFTQRSLDNMAARYLAEQGIDSALTEIKYNTGFHTHTVNSQTLALEKVEETFELKLENARIDDDGNYSSDCSDSSAGCFKVKVYPDPNNFDELVVLAKGMKGTASRLLATKYVASSLYRFFIFTPYNYWFGGKDYDAGNGGIHANGWFVFNGDANISNVSEMSTAKYIKYDARGFVPPGETDVPKPGAGRNYTWDEVFWKWRAPWIENPNPAGSDCPNGNCQYYNNQDGTNYGDYHGRLLMRRGSQYIYWDGTPGAWLDPYNPANFNVYACLDHTCAHPDIENNTRWTSVNNIFIPNRMESSYNWNPYQALEEGGYWNDEGRGYWSLGQFWTYPSSNIDAYHFNSDTQYIKWNEFLESEAGQSLANILLDANRGGEHIEPLGVGNGAAYKDAAQEDGIYIEYDIEADPPELNVKINGVLQTWTGDQIKINDIGVFVKNNFVDTNSAQTKNVLTIDMDSLLDATGDIAHGGLEQNIIYSNYPLVIRSAFSIPTEGLTTVCRENVYLHGNYNISPAEDEYPPDWKPPPSAVISAKYTFTLSPYFNFPQTLLDTLTNPNAPYEQDFISGSRNWYAEHELNMPNKVDGYVGSNFTYNVALVGYRGHEPQVLERWGWWGNPGDIYTAPSDWLSAERTINGAFVQLQKDDFEWVGYPEESIPTFDFWKQRCCSEGFPPGECRDCSQYPGWPWMAASRIPDYEYDHRWYDTQFASGNVPPGDLVGFSTTVFLELDLSDSLDPWIYHSTQITSPPQSPQG